MLETRPPSCDVPRASRAAQYVRMSRDHQKYSPENQRTVIAAYASQRNIEVVRTYIDEGRSGLTIIGRDGLKKLIADVQSGSPDFNCILVYDVSRWGRFQDTDESAFYEYICKRAGISVHYCAEEFENDGSLASVVLKSLSRVDAADFSRKLSRRVFVSHCHFVTLGFWRGGPPGYGFRRQTVDEVGKPRVLLLPGEQKHFKLDRVVLVPGPKSEIDVVQRIFADFASRKLTRTEIANKLNAEGIFNAMGRPWMMQTIDDVLRNEKYVGHNVFNRRSSKLMQKPIENPPDMWIRRNNSFEPIVSQALFDKAQRVLSDLDHGRKLSDLEILSKLKALWRRKGHLSMRLLERAKDLPDWTVYARRFGSLMKAYQQIGFEPKPRYRYVETGLKIDAIIRATAEGIISNLKAGGGTSFLPELYLLTAETNLTIAIAVAWSVSDGTVAGRRSRRWEVRKLRYSRSDFVLVIRMDAANSETQDYFLVPTPNLPPTQGRRKLRVSDRIFGQFRHDDLGSVLHALREKLRQRRES
ncbi:recombinase family protein [Bradyrhizobium sp. CCGUVB14]|uniref:recombinase family protein n=1 Tax=Bradyrhizobium sp. CCGUVB14 TaxID=2949628 RepID=UPI00211587A2|nr:recombinase family protein [Bradyrhizobium sp. CCGUVB14]